ncbi:MAG TPA: DUF6266 family protein [Puia sp.]|nr:DUF6266 family protein [Puia sp.]
MKTIKKEIRTSYSWRPEQRVVIDGANTSIIQFEPPHPKRRFSETERQRYAGLTLVMRAMTSVKPFIEQLHERVPRGEHAFLRLSELNQQIPVKGVFPWLQVDYSRLILSQGDLPGVLFPEAFPGEDFELKFGWGGIPGYGAKANDRVFVLVYCEALNHWLYILYCAERKDCAFTLALDAFRDEFVHAWMGLRSADGQRISNVDYCGEIFIP